jgi:hypothetical protein
MEVLYLHWKHADSAWNIGVGHAQHLLMTKDALLMACYHVTAAEASQSRHTTLSRKSQKARASTCGRDGMRGGTHKALVLADDHAHRLHVHNQRPLTNQQCCWIRFRHLCAAARYCGSLSVLVNDSHVVASLTERYMLLTSGSNIRTSRYEMLSSSTRSCRSICTSAGENVHSNVLRLRSAMCRQARSFSLRVGAAHRAILQFAALVDMQPPPRLAVEPDRPDLVLAGVL